MASQFTLYTSSDYGSPGPLLCTGAGGLLNIFNQCLVSGYSGHAAAGWTKLGSVGRVINDSSNVGIFKQGAGCGYYLYLNDNAPDGGGGAVNKGAYARGYKTMTALTPTGWGTFPTDLQVATETGGTANYGIVKGIDTNTARPWQLYADSSTFYFFMFDGNGGYGSYMFGDIYSLWGSSDLNRCAICLAGGDRGAGALPNLAYGCLDRQLTPLVTTAADMYGFYMSDSYAGTVGSTVGYPVGDPSKYNGVMAAGTPLPLIGSIPFPNPADSSYHISPIWVLDYNWNIRGRLRGLWYPCHPLVNFSDGASISGTNDLSPKTFNVICPGWGNGVFLMETSNTVETN